MIEDSNETTQQLKTSLESALKSHDWYFAFSDDQRAYAAGKASSDRLSAVYESYKAAAGEDAALAAWNAAAPADFKKTRAVK